MFRKICAVSVVIVFALVINGCGGADDPVDNATVLIDLGKNDKALELLDQVLLEDPKNVEVHLLRGRAYLGMGDFEAADDAFGDAIAVGGKPAAKQVDELLIRRYDKTLRESVSGSSREATESFFLAIGTLRLLNDSEKRAEALTNTFDLLVEQRPDWSEIDELTTRVLNGEMEPSDIDDEVSEKFWQESGKEVEKYEMVAEQFVERAEFKQDEVESALVDVAEKIARLAEEYPSCWTLAWQLNERHGSDDDFLRIAKILGRYSRDSGNASRTVSDMRVIATALMVYAGDNGKYPEAESIEALRKYLVPTYIGKIPLADGWGNEFLIKSKGSTFLLVAAGADGNFDGSYSNNGKTWPLKRTSDYAEDIIIADGDFRQYPEDVEL